MNKHTPAPWLIAESDKSFVYALNKKGINQFWVHVSGNPVLTHEFEEELVANARLIAAAPDLLYAIESIVEMNPELPMGVIEAAQEAIAKATGDGV